MAPSSILPWLDQVQVCLMIDRFFQLKPHLIDQSCHLQDNKPWRSVEEAALERNTTRNNFLHIKTKVQVSIIHILFIL